MAALDEACRLLGVRGRVLPATIEPVVLKAEAAGGPVAGQVAVMGTDNIRSVSLVPSDPEAPDEAVTALDEADQIVLGPGSLFTSVLAAAVVPAVRDGIARSSAAKVYVCNLRQQIPETEGFDVARHVGCPGRSWGRGGRGGLRHLGHGPRVRRRYRCGTRRWPGPTGWPTIPASWRQSSPICSDAAPGGEIAVAWMPASGPAGDWCRNRDQDGSVGHRTRRVRRRK